MTLRTAPLASLLGLALALAPGHAQLLNTIFPEAPRPTRPELPAAAVQPVLPAAPQMPEVGYTGLIGGGPSGLQNRNDPSYQILIRRLTLELQDAQYAFQRAAQGQDQQATASAYQRVLIAQRRLQIAQTNPSALFFPMFTATGDFTNPGMPDPGQGQPPISEEDAGMLPGDTRRLVFRRIYVRWPGNPLTRSQGRINRFSAGRLVIYTGQGSRSEAEGEIQRMPGNDFFNFFDDNEEENPKAQWFSADVEDPRNPARTVRGWRFRKIQGDPKRRQFEDHLELRGETNELNAYNAAGVRFARIRHETYQVGDEQKTARVYYVTGSQEPVASLTEGTFDGTDPALILRPGRGVNADGEESEVLFYMVFTGWLPENDAHPQDGALRKGLGRFLDAWIMSEPWRNTVGIAHNFDFGDD